MNNSNSRISIQDAVFLLYDTESTGDNSKGTDKPIELAALKFNLYKGIIGKPWSSLIQPNMPIHPGSRAIHGLVDADLVGQPTLEELMPSFLEYVGDYPLVAHNIAFDLNMVPILHDEKYIKLDNLKIANIAYKIGDIGFNNQDLRSHREQELRYWLNIDVDTEGLPAHRALSDIIVMSEIFRDASLKIIEKHNIQYLDEFVEFIHAPLLKETMPFGKFKGMTIPEAIQKDMADKSNYFSWLYGKWVESEKNPKPGEQPVDSDLKYSIEYYLKKENPTLATTLFNYQPKSTLKP